MESKPASNLEEEKEEVNKSIDVEKENIHEFTQEENKLETISNKLDINLEKPRDETE